VKLILLGPVYPYRGGIAHHSTLLAKSLTDLNHLVHVLSFRRQYPRWLYPGASDRDPSTAPLRFPAEYLLDPLVPWTWSQVSKRIAALTPDLVVMPWWSPFWAPSFGFIANKLRREQIPLIFLIHNVLPHEIRPWDERLTKWVLRKGDAYVVQSGSEVARLLSFFPEAKYIHCPHPVYEHFAQARIPKAEARKRLAIPVDAKVILFFGIVRPYKGLANLLAALGKIDEKMILLVAGEFWEPKEQYQTQIQQLGLQSMVRIVDRYIPDEEVPDYFSAADLFVAPYKTGTQSGAVTIAKSYGLPMIVSQAITDSLPQIKGDPQLVIVPPDDPQALAVALENLIDGLKASGLEGAESEPAHPAVGQSWQDLVHAIETLAKDLSINN
jgi:glycosyltransferase involved in cell wall biosynthesis